MLTCLCGAVLYLHVVRGTLRGFSFSRSKRGNGMGWRVGWVGGRGWMDGWKKAVLLHNIHVNGAWQECSREGQKLRWAWEE